MLLSAKPHAVFTFVSGFATANYKPPNWHSVMLPTIAQHNIFTQTNMVNWFWIKFLWELVSLDFYNKRLIEQMLSADFLSQYLACHPSDLSYLQILGLYQAFVCRQNSGEITIDCQEYILKAIRISQKYVMCPLKNYLEFELGKNNVLSRVETKYGHFIEHLIVMKRDTGEFVNVEAFKRDDSDVNGMVLLEDIQCLEDEIK